VVAGGVLTDGGIQRLLEVLCFGRR
jgi:hypothetical protein